MLIKGRIYYCHPTLRHVLTSYMFCLHNISRWGQLSSSLDGNVLMSGTHRSVLSCNLCAGLSLCAAETYVNRYKQGWVASSQVAQQYFNECSKKGRKTLANAAPSIPLSEIPLPVPISRFIWPQVRSPPSLTHSPD